MDESKSDPNTLRHSDVFEPDDGFGPTLLQELTGINGAKLSSNLWHQSVEHNLQLLVGPIKRVGHLQKHSVQPGPTGKVDHGTDF